MVIMMNVNEIKKGLDNVQEQLDDLQDKVNILKGKLDLASRIIRMHTFSEVEYEKDKEISRTNKCILIDDDIDKLLNVLEN